MKNSLPNGAPKRDSQLISVANPLRDQHKNDGYFPHSNLYCREEESQGIGSCNFEAYLRSLKLMFVFLDWA